MKVIRYSEDKFTFEGDEADRVKWACQGQGKSLVHLAEKVLKITYKTYWAKSTNYEGSYFDALEIQRIEAFTGIKFEKH